jgi:peptidoglycan/xylan/chitin deacetylase (PgdA/CDA1 family)
MRQTLLGSFSTAGCLLALACTGVKGQQPAPTNAPSTATSQSQPGTRLSVDQLEQQAFHLAAGVPLRPKAWPNSAKVAVALSFDLDDETPSLRSGDLGSEPMTRGEYAAIQGVPRILGVLARQNVPASFYIPAVSAILHPQLIKEIQESGKHEIGVHGWIHEDLPALNNEAEEQRLLNQAIDTLTKMTGRRPVGYRAPSWHFSQFTMKQIKAAGFLYDSSLMSSDDAYEISVDGQPTGVIELPIERIVDDSPYFGNNANGSLPAPELVERIFQSEFDVAYDEGGLYVLTMHPNYTGHRSRAAALEQLIVHMKSKAGVWFATEEQIARYVKEASAQQTTH